MKVAELATEVMFFSKPVFRLRCLSAFLVGLGACAADGSDTVVEEGADGYSFVKRWCDNEEGLAEDGSPAHTEFAQEGELCQSDQDCVCPFACAPSTDLDDNGEALRRCKTRASRLEQCTRDQECEWGLGCFETSFTTLEGQTTTRLICDEADRMSVLEQSRRNFSGDEGDLCLEGESECKLPYLICVAAEPGEFHFCQTISVIPGM